MLRPQGDDNGVENRRMIHFIDIEASALDDGYPIEIGWAVLDPDAPSPEQGITSDAVLIRPPAWWQETKTWSPAAEAVHGIKLQDLMDHGVAVDTAAARVRAAFDGATDGVLWSDDGTHWDRDWIATLFAAAVVEPPAVEIEDLDALIGSLGQPFDRMRYERAVRWLDHQPVRHRAAEDARLKAEFVWRYINGTA